MSLTPVARFRFCHKCACLFREAGPGDGTPNKCPAGGVHEAMGYTFEIPAADQETYGADTVGILQQVHRDVLQRVSR